MANPLQEDHGLIRVHEASVAMHAAWRPTPCHDIGIDGQIEFLEHQSSTGKLVAVQVKSGPSFFTHVDGNDFKYYPSAKHVLYWRALNIPVLLVLHNPDIDLTIYADVKLQLDIGDGPIRVPKHQTLSASSRDEILGICDRVENPRPKLAEHEFGYEDQPEFTDEQLQEIEARLDALGENWFESEDGQRIFEEYTETLQQKQAEQFTRDFLPKLPIDIREQRMELANGITALLKACRACPSWDNRSEYKLTSWLAYVPEEMLSHTSLPNLLTVQKNMLQYLKIHQDMDVNVTG